MTSAFVRPEATATITVPNPIVIEPGYDVTVYSQDWEAGQDGWSAGSGTNVYNVIGSSGSSHTGAGKLSTQRATTSGVANTTKTLSGFIVGQPTTVTVWVNNVSDQPLIGATITVTGKGSSTPINPTSAGGWVQLTHNFTPTATSHAVILSATQSPAPIYWDTIRVVRHVPAVLDDTVELPISQGKVTLDENYSPYVVASFSVPLESEELLEQIDPRATQRVTVTASEGVSGLSRTYNLGVRSRTVNHDDQTIDIEAASDEILLHERRNVSTTVDNTPRTYETSLRGICSWALGKIGATLAPGTNDANLTAYWDATNLIPDPRLTGTASMTTAANASGVWDTTFPGPINGVAHQGLHLSLPSNVDAYANIGPTSGMAFGMQEGKTYVFSATGSVRGVIGGVGPSEADAAYGTVMNRQRALVVHASGVGFSPPYKVWHSPQVSNVAQTGASAGFRVSVKFTVPKGTLHVFLRAYHGGSSGSISWSQFQLVEAGPGTTADDNKYFFGSKPAETGYTYKWRELPDYSASERVAVVERLPSLLAWRPGQSLFDFLQPLINASGLRLFCDESRVWRLVDPADYEVPGYVVAQAKHNAVKGTDTITRNDDTWADAVVVIYTWTSDGETQTAYDVAGNPNGKAIVRELDREYPGPGAAQYILDSFTGRGRTQNVTALGQYGATPGQDVTINLPGTLTQTGKVRAITFDLHSGLMDIETRGLTDALPGSWATWNPSQTWAAVTPTLKWKDA